MTPDPAQPRTASESGLALAALLLGVGLAVGTVPLAFVLSDWGMISALMVIPFSLIGVVFGAIGRRSPLGVAGMALSAIAVLEAAGTLAWIQHIVKQDLLARVEVEKQNTIQATKVAEKANADLARARAEAETRHSAKEEAAAHARTAEKQRQAEVERRRTAEVELQSDQLDLKKKEHESAAAFALAAAKEKEIAAQRQREKAEMERLELANEIAIRKAAERETWEREKQIEKEAAARKMPVEKYKDWLLKRATAIAAAPLYVMNDKTEIRAVTVIDAQDLWTIKDENDKIHNVRKVDVMEIVSPGGEKTIKRIDD